MIYYFQVGIALPWKWWRCSGIVQAWARQGQDNNKGSTQHSQIYGMCIPWQVWQTNQRVEVAMGSVHNGPGFVICFSRDYDNSQSVTWAKHCHERLCCLRWLDTIRSTTNKQHTYMSSTTVKGTTYQTGVQRHTLFRCTNIKAYLGTDRDNMSVTHNTTNTRASDTSQISVWSKIQWYG